MPYGGGAWMVLKAQPIIDAVRFCIDNIQQRYDGATKKIKVILLWPSEKEFDQSYAHMLIDDYTDIILICWRYEGIDHRVECWCQQIFAEDFQKISLGKYVTLWGEVPAMAIVEATARLLPWVINQEASWQDESYRPENDRCTLEYPQYTRPYEVENLRVPDILLSGHHQHIEQWRKNSTRIIDYS